MYFYCKINNYCSISQDTKTMLIATRGPSPFNFLKQKS